MERIADLEAFYRFMERTGEIRRRITAVLLRNTSPAGNDVSELRGARDLMEELTGPENRMRLKVEGDRKTEIDVSYEKTELEKDLFFLERGEERFLGFLADRHPGFSGEVDSGTAFLRDFPVRAFVSDRDGTVNNYCSRYRSSIQSVWNALFLSRYAETVPVHSLLLTSAPLRGGGIADVSVNPDGIFSYAGSKGREYRSVDGREGKLPLDPEEERALRRLNRRLGDLTERKEYRVFALIGSGLQYKYGQTTVARQDITGSVPEERSRRWLETVRDAVREEDPAERFFRIEDTGLDIEIMLTVGEDGSGLKDFDKGDGIDFLDRELGLELDRGPTLVCGDTGSDVSMARTAREKGGASRTIFVDADETLREKVRATGAEALFVSSPDVLVAILNRAAADRPTSKEQI